MRVVAIVSALIVVVCAGLSYWAISTTPQLSALKPEGATNDATPTIVGHVSHARDLRASDVKLTVSGNEVSDVTVRNGVVTGHVTRKLASGKHHLTFRAGSIGVLNRKVSGAWTIVVDTTAPRLNIMSPAARLTTAPTGAAAAAPATDASGNTRGSDGAASAAASNPEIGTVVETPAPGSTPAPTTNVASSAGAATDTDSAATATAATTTAPAQVRVRTIDKRHAAFRIRTEPGAHVTVTPAHGTAGVAVADNDGLANVKATFADGTQRVIVSSRDDAGNDTRAGVRVLVDAKAPVLTLPEVAGGIVATQEPAFAATVVDSTPVTVVATLGGQADGVVVKQAEPTMWRVTSEEALPEGVHQLDIVVTDAVGHVSRQHRSFLIDSTEELGDAGLGRGARGNDVRELQTVLRTAKVFSPTTGKGLAEWNGHRYGPATASAVRTWQGQHGMSADGVAGSATVAGLTMRIVINQAAHTLTLFKIGKVFKTYHVAVGQAKYPTPVGQFHIVNKAENPTWTPPKDSPWAKGAKAIPPGPHNPLGTRWMGINVPNVGIHGTDNPASIGFSVSHGCIRMAIPDIEDLFERVQVGTSVEIV